MLPAHQFSGVMTLERFGQVVQELQESCGVIIAEPKRQTDERHIVRFHRGYRDRFCRRAARSAAFAAAAS